MRTLPQHDHADLGLVDNDDTEDLRPATKSAPEVRQHRRGDQNNHIHITELEF